MQPPSVSERDQQQDVDEPPLRVMMVAEFCEINGGRVRYVINDYGVEYIPDGGLANMVPGKWLRMVEAFVATRLFACHFASSPHMERLDASKSSQTATMFLDNVEDPDDPDAPPLGAVICSLSIPDYRARAYIRTVNIAYLASDIENLRWMLPMLSLELNAAGRQICAAAERLFERELPLALRALEMAAEAMKVGVDGEPSRLLESMTLRHKQELPQELLTVRERAAQLPRKGQCNTAGEGSFGITSAVQHTLTNSMNNHSTETVLEYLNELLVIRGSKELRNLASICNEGNKDQTSSDLLLSAASDAESGGGPSFQEQTPMDIILQDLQRVAKMFHLERDMLWEIVGGCQGPLFGRDRSLGQVASRPLTERLMKSELGGGFCFDIGIENPYRKVRVVPDHIDPLKPELPLLWAFSLCLPQQLMPRRFAFLKDKLSSKTLDLIYYALLGKNFVIMNINVPAEKLDKKTDEEIRRTGESYRDMLYRVITSWYVGSKTENVTARATHDLWPRDKRIDLHHLLSQRIIFVHKDSAQKAILGLPPHLFVLLDGNLATVSGGDGYGVVGVPNGQPQLLAQPPAKEGLLRRLLPLDFPVMPSANVMQHYATWALVCAEAMRHAWNAPDGKRHVNVLHSADVKRILCLEDIYPKDAEIVCALATHMANAFR